MSKNKFSKKKVVKTVQLWCDNVVKVGKEYSDGGNYKEVAKKILSDNYDYDHGHVLFKPTLAFGIQTYRPTKAGALAYFIGGDKDFPDDKGFKLKPWVKVWYEKLDFIIHNDIAAVQCNVHLIGADDSHLFVNKSFVFKICEDERIRIILHQSSLPYIPDPKP